MAATDRAIRVGGVMLLSRSGFLEAGRHLKAGLELAVADVNGLGGVGGRPRELLVRDTGAGPAEAVAIMDELHEEGVAAIAGEYHSVVARAIAARAAQLGLAFVCSSAATARIMQTTPELVTVSFRELGEGGIWCCDAGEPEPAALISCDIRRGRPPEQRGALAQALIESCVETLGLRSDRLVVEFTQHTSDEMYRAGRGWGTEWTPAEATDAA